MKRSKSPSKSPSKAPMRAPMRAPKQRDYYLCLGDCECGCDEKDGVCSCDCRSCGAIWSIKKRHNKPPNNNTRCKKCKTFIKSVVSAPEIYNIFCCEDCNKKWLSPSLSKTTMKCQNKLCNKLVKCSDYMDLSGHLESIKETFEYVHHVTIQYEYEIAREKLANEIKMLHFKYKKKIDEVKDEMK